MQHVRVMNSAAAVEYLRELGAAEERERAAVLCEQRARSAEISGHPGLSLVRIELLAVAVAIRQGAPR